jgi:hypothetical protein
MPRPSSPIRITSRSCDLPVQTSCVGAPADGAADPRRRSAIPGPVDLRANHGAVVSDLYDQTNPQAVEIDRLRRRLVELEAELDAGLAELGAENERLLGLIDDAEREIDALLHEHDRLRVASARLAEVEAENERLREIAIEAWHRGDYDVPLHEFLGLSWKDYAAWVEVRGADTG